MLMLNARFPDSGFQISDRTARPYGKRVATTAAVPSRIVTIWRSVTRCPGPTPARSSSAVLSDHSSSDCRCSRARFLPGRGPARRRRWRTGPPPLWSWILVCPQRPLTPCHPAHSGRPARNSPGHEQRSLRFADGVDHGRLWRARDADSLAQAKSRQRGPGHLAGRRTGNGIPASSPASAWVNAT